MLCRNSLFATGIETSASQRNGVDVSIAADCLNSKAADNILTICNCEQVYFGLFPFSLFRVPFQTSAVGVRFDSNLSLIRLPRKSDLKLRLVISLELEIENCKYNLFAKVNIFMHTIYVHFINFMKLFINFL